MTEGSKTEKLPAPQDNVVTTTHTLRIRGKTIRYKVDVGTFVLKEEVDKQGHKPKAEMFFIAFLV